MHGNSRTTPRGIEMLELPFNRNGRRKNANLELVFGFVLTSSSVGMGGDVEGILLRTLCTKPIDADELRFVGEMVVIGGGCPRSSMDSAESRGITTSIGKRKIESKRHRGR